MSLTYDPRAIEPEPEDWDSRPGFEAERAFYDALGDWRKEDPEALTPGPECPVCKGREPVHQLGCWIAGDWTSASHYEPTEHHLPEHF